jgi:hypothetical protein
MEPDELDLVCGVDRRLVEEFLALIRDNYRKADQATAFLEPSGTSLECTCLH